MLLLNPVEIAYIKIYSSNIIQICYYSKTRSEGNLGARLSHIKFLNKKASGIVIN